jgi:hypothetical protein
MIIGTTVLNWYQSDFADSVALIESFVSLMEKQVEDAIHKYKTEKRTEMIEEDLGDEQGTQGWPVETYGGLESMTWSFQTVFEEHFPSLQRRSALITVYSYFEHELHELCILFQSEKKFRLIPSDLRGQGIEQSTDYLKKVVGLNINKNSSEWKTLKHVRQIRNMIVHRDGTLRDSQGNISHEDSDAIVNLKYLRDQGGILLEKGFVAQVVDIFKSYFKLIGDEIQENEKHPQ